MAATTDESTPPDMATTTRVCAGGLARPRLLSGIRSRAASSARAAVMGVKASRSRLAGQNGHFAGYCKKERAGQTGPRVIPGNYKERRRAKKISSFQHVLRQIRKEIAPNRLGKS